MEKVKSNTDLEIMIGRNLDSMKEMLVKMHSEIMEPIALLLDHKKMQIDENRKISKRLDSAIKDGEQATRELRAVDSTIGDFYHELSNKLSHFVEQLGVFKGNYDLKILEIENSVDRKISSAFRYSVVGGRAPFKCPVCEARDEECRVCEGAGVIWR